MKNAQIKTAFVLAIIFVMCGALSYGLSVKINSPNATWVLDSSVKMNFTPTAEVTVLPWCEILSNRTGTYTTTANYTNVPNGTPFVRGIAFGDSIGQNYAWNVKCYNGSEVVKAAGKINASFGVDSSEVSVTLDSPVYNKYFGTGTVTLVYTPLDTANLDACMIYHNLTGTWGANETNNSVTNLSSDRADTRVYTSQGDGAYMWNVYCNDTAGHTAWAEDTNRTFVIDSTNPTDIKIVKPNNNNTVSDSQFFNVTWNQTTETNFDKYLVKVATDLLLTNVLQTIEISNRTLNITEVGRLENEGTYYIQVGAYDSLGHSANTSVLSYTYDVANATFIYAPLNNTYTNDAIPTFNVTVVDDNADFCSLYLSAEDNLTDVTFNRSIGVTNNTLANFSVEGLSDGPYYFNIECNDTNDDELNVSDSALLRTIDTTSPTEPYLLISWGMTNNTDKSPTVSWANVTETNFDYYAVLARYIGNASKAYEVNVTSIASGGQNVDVVLPVKGTYNFTVTAYDLAGNSDSSTNTTLQTTYYVDDVCGTLATGWNLCGATWGSSRNLSVIGSETSATFVTVWNKSNHVWASCSVGVSSQNCDLKVGINTNDTHAVWVYVNESTEWNNRTWTAQNNNANITLSNTTNGIGWNLEGGFFRNGRTFGALGRDFGFNNVTMFSLNYNNGTSASYVNIAPYTNMSINTTLLDFGRGMWIYSNISSGSHTFDVGSW